MSTVWIANEAGHNYEKARVFGDDLKPLTLGNINPLQVDRLIWHLARGIGKYVREDDYLLVSGTPIISAMALLLWMTHFKKCQILLWNASGREYELTTVEMDHVQNLIEREIFRP